MRAGGCTVHQALSNDAATIIKQAVTLARRRGHAQVTPLHVASTLLSSSSGLLRTACLQSHSHPLQCKALELCFNVALNRLPTSSSPLLGHHSHPHPSISNALIAAFKRAQAHQRRGSSDTQQQPLLAVKIELEQLIISILDDPSVSRVMKEADFSSTEVKTNVEQVVSLDLCSWKTKEDNHTSPTTTTTSPCFQVGDKLPTLGTSPDVSKVIESMMNIKKRNTVVIGESAAAVECVIKGVKLKFENKDIPELLKDVKFTNLQSHNIPNLSKDEIERKLVEIRSLICDSHLNKSGLILFIGDLKWISDSWIESNSKGTDHQRVIRNIHRRYHPLEHMVVELGKLVTSYSRLWIMGVASFQTYMNCRCGHPSIQSLLDLHAVTIGTDNLALKLNTESNGDLRNLSRYSSITSNSSQYSSDTTSTLPKWLQECKNEITKTPASVDQDYCRTDVDIVCEKWSSKCTTLNKQRCSSEKTMVYSTPVLSPSSSSSTYYLNHSKSSYSSPSVVFTENDKQSFIDSNRGYPLNLRSSYSYPNSPSRSDAMESYKSRSGSKSEELNVDNLKKICSALEIKVPWQKDIIPEIVNTMLQCRSGLVKRRGKWQLNDLKKYETWFYFEGLDVDGKEKIGHELARVIFGSYTKFVSISLSSFSSPRSDSVVGDYLKNKRGRDEQSLSYIERFGEEVSCDPHRVFLVEDFEQADYSSQLGIKKAIERGRIMTSSGQEVSLYDAIIILSCESFSSRSRTSSPSMNIEMHGVKYDHDDHNHSANVADLNLEDIISPCVSLDLDLNISVDDDGITEDQFIDEIGILDSVDKRVVFNLVKP